MDLECYDFTGQRMVGIQRYLSAVDLSDGDQCHSVVRTYGPEALANLRGQASLDPFLVDGDKHAVPVPPEGVLGLECYRLLVSGLHADDGLINPRNDPLTTNRELKWTAPRGCKANRTIVELAGIVDLHRAADSDLFVRSLYDSVGRRFHGILIAGPL
jgi:hypothetical protein